MSNSLQSHGLCCPWSSPGQNTGVGSLSLLQGVFPTQGSNSGLPHCRQILYQLSHKGSPRILAWIAYPFSRESSQPKDWTQVSHTAGGFFTSWATREAQEYWSGGPSLLQWIFPTQESNWGLLHCRRNLYQLSHQGTPNIQKPVIFLYTKTQISERENKTILLKLH